MFSSHLKIKEKFFKHKKSNLQLSTPGWIIDAIEEEIPTDINELPPSPYYYYEREGEPEEIHEKMDIPTYSYLEENPLNRLFDLFDNGENKMYTVYTCMYIIPDDREPSLLFLIEKTARQLSFPSFSYQAMEIMDDENSSSESPENIHFSNSCLEHALSIIDWNIHDEEGTDLSKLYKGFLPFDENTLFSVFDFTRFSKKVSNKCLANMEHILIEKKMENILFDSIIPDFFLKFPYMGKIVFTNL